MRLTEETVRAAVRAEATGYRPDRDAMLDRVTRTVLRDEVAGKRSPVRLRMAGAAVAMTALLGGGGIAQWALAADGDGQPVPPPPVVTASPSPTVTAPVVPDTSSPAPDTTSSSTPRPSRTTSPSLSPPAATTGQATPAGPAPITADGSVDPTNGDTQGNSVVTFTTTERLTAFQVEIKVTRTPELASRGGSRQVPGASVTTSVSEEPDALIYRFEMSSGDSVGPGTYTFFARYTYASGGRDATGDAYAITAVTESGARVNVPGDFE
ncbi:hypothetical protein [Actinoplanes sp. NPDC051494]|uniref:hypothetical protein n=1 Tax=Actinoplanes sp. NPDC051494 TaxID=3363907 RepID=UPI00378B0F2B